MRKIKHNDCKYYQRAINSEEKTEGTCHRYPPTIVQYERIDEDYSKFPPVKYYCWCGEYKLKHKNKEQDGTI